MKLFSLSSLIIFLTSLSACSTSSQTASASLPMTLLTEPAYTQRNALLNGSVTAEALTKAYLQRIKQYDGQINSVLALAPDAIAQARALDKKLAKGTEPGPLFGLPILIKDNIETRELPTTAGSLALQHNLTGRDAPLVARLRAADAIILGKTNLSEWANFRSENSVSGWSAVGGLTRNPFSLNRSACGSSSGSGAAMAMHFAALTVGTETNGSIICPASFNGVVGFKPSVGVIPRTHIIPISSTQDTAGPIVSTTGDAMMMMAVMKGPDNQDKSSEQVPAKLKFHQATATSLTGMRVGVVRFDSGSEKIQARYNQAIDVFKQQGAVLIELTEFSLPEGFWDASYTVLLNEFKRGINDYLQSSPAPLPVNSLPELIAYNEQQSAELALFDQSIFERVAESEGPHSSDYYQALSLIQQQSGINGIDKLLASHNLNVLIAPSNNPAFLIDTVYGDQAPDGFAGIGYLAAIAGYPHLTIPVGLVRGLPVGLSIIGSKYDDERVLATGMEFEAKRDKIKPLLQARPQLHKNIEGNLLQPAKKQAVAQESD